MSLYRLELKRVCKTRMTAILLAIALVLAVVMAYLPVTFIGWTELDASGNEVRYTGLKAIRKRQELRQLPPRAGADRAAPAGRAGRAGRDAHRCR